MGAFQQTSELSIIQNIFNIINDELIVDTDEIYGLIEYYMTYIKDSERNMKKKIMKPSMNKNRFFQMI